MNYSSRPNEPSVHARHSWRSILWPTLLAATFLLAVVSCKQQAATKPADVDYYTCTMHPSVKMQNPTDKCPICSMNLVPVKKKNAAPPDAAGGHAAPEGHAGHLPPSAAPTEP